MSKRPTPKRKVMVVTGSRSEFGLLRPVMEAVRKNKRLALQVVVAGEHLLAPASTWREVDEAFGIDARVPMQKKGDKGRADHAAACGRGVEGFARVIKKIKPDWVVVLGDRIEAFAAASAASIAGVAVCHIHGGDRAEGIADEAMRHAITKLSHLHCAATKLSAERIVKMGEPRASVHVTGSPAIDGLSACKAPGVAEFEIGLENPGAIVLMHPAGLLAEEEFLWATIAGLVAISIAGERPVIWLEPNHDPGRESVVRALEKLDWPGGLMRSSHMPRPLLIGLLRALARRGGALVGNSSAGLIEAESTGIPVVNVGPRQSGREQHARVASLTSVERVGPLDKWPGVVRRLARAAQGRTYGDGRAGPRIAALLAKTDPHDPALLRKRIAY